MLTFFSLNHNDDAGGCLSCQNESECAYVSASMSPDHQYYMLTCNGPGVPTYTLYSVTNNTQGIAMVGGGRG